MRKFFLASLALPIIFGTTSCTLPIWDDRSIQSQKVVRYSDFIEAVQEKQVTRILISPDKGTAQVVKNDGSRALVNLAPDQELLKLLTDNDVDIAFQPTQQASPLQQTITSLIFPILLFFFVAIPAGLVGAFVMYMITKKR